MAPQKGFACVLCKDADTDDMVQCDFCNSWTHYSCANVTSAIESQTFKCKACEKKADQDKAKADQKARELAERRTTEKAREEQKAREKAEQKAREKEERDKIEREKLEREKAERDRLEREEAERQRIEMEMAERQQLESEKNKKAKLVKRKRAKELLKVIEDERKAAEERDRLYFERKTKLISELQISDDSLCSDDELDNVSTKNVDNSLATGHAGASTSASNPPIPKTVSSANINESQSQPVSSRPSLPWLNASSQEDFMSSTSVNASQVVPNEVSFLDSVRKMSKIKRSYDLPIFNGTVSEWPMFICSYMRSTASLNLTNLDNLDRLQKCLRGEALKLVQPILVYEDSVPRVLATLRMKFGRPDVIIQNMMKQVRAVPKLNIENMSSILDFSVTVQQLCVTMEASGMNNHLNNPNLLQELVDKLPGNQKLEWASYMSEHQPVNLASFDYWLSKLADRACTVASSSSDGLQLKSRESENKNTKRTTNQRSDYLNSTSDTHPKHQEPSTSNAKQPCVICSSKDHTVESCPTFLTKTTNDRWSDVKTFNLCRKCLQKHFWKSCKSRKPCEINGCLFRHHPLLHDPVKHANVTMPTEANVCAIHSPTPSKVLFRVVPVVLYGPSSNVKTFAFLDEGSSRTLLDESVAKVLGLNGPVEPLHLKWTGDVTRDEMQSRRVSIEISADEEAKKKYRISNVRTVSQLNLFHQTLHYDPQGTKYQHLQNLPLKSYVNATPQILIGIEHWQLGMPLKIREGNWGEPIATKTRLGWTIFGTLSPKGPDELNEVGNYHICDCNNDDTLHKAIKEFFSFESLGVKTPEHALISRDDQRAAEILEKTTKRIGDRFETGLLWRQDDVKFPDSFNMALQRLNCLERKMMKNPVLSENLRNQIADYVKKGYARKLSSEEILEPNPRIWYLPTFVVSNPNKPSKIRIVWDAAARVNGISLNLMLVKGPDLLCSLPEILFRFRERPVAIAGDIKEMYHQVSIIDDDRHSQRFLWRDNPQKQPDVYIMNVMTFGACCSPSAAHYVKNKNASEFAKESPAAVEAILRNHYVDDWLESFASEKDAVRTAKEVSRIHSKGGFTIRNWVSNSEYVLTSLGEAKPNNDQLSLNIANDTTGTKVLGLYWDTRRDAFFFNLVSSRIDRELLIGTRRPTKREVLRTLMLIFDPLGLISSFLVYVKILLQDIWRSDTDWDQQINAAHYVKWLNWTRMLPLVQEIMIPRCYSYEQFDSVQLHVFVDASDSAYAAAAYFRFNHAKGKISCSLIAAKTKVAPLQPQSIPRLELQAAVLGARLSNSLLSAHTLKPEKTVLWTDSIDVMCWLRSDARKFRQFVALRVGEILETTDLASWRWVPTKENPADEATKWKDSPKIANGSRWFTGPDFLRLPEANWPVEMRQISKIRESEEIKPQMSHVESEDNVFTTVCERSSSWRKAFRVSAWILRYVHNKTSKEKVLNAALQPTEINRAKSMLYRESQRCAYAAEIASLKKWPEKSIDKTSSIYKLSPFLDKHNVLRVRGRTSRCEVISFDVINPVILPRHHKITQLLVTHFHNKYLHANHETVVNELRQLYVIPQLRVVLNQISTNCQACKNQRALPKAPEMANLPRARVAAFSRPFSFVGIDFFGPLEVVVGRHVEKRWGCLFSCLTVRAIHIEIAYTLSKDSCMMCIRKFIARRGMPLEIRSDNGTNLIGVKNELKRIFLQMSTDEIKTKFDEITWILNPPAAPHMGGSWERQVQSIKKCLEAQLPTRRPDDENLYCYLVEVECMINSRPLTYLPVKPDEPEALTPNHFLMGSSGGSKPFCEFETDDLSMRKNYKLSQVMSLHFWKRWLREYLPELTRRTRWYEKVKPISVGNIVVIMDEGKRSSWCKGVVVETVVGKNSDQVRQVKVKTATGTFLRPATKVAVLDVELDSKPNSNSDQPDALLYQLTREENVRKPN